MTTSSGSGTGEGAGSERSCSGVGMKKSESSMSNVSTVMRRSLVRGQLMLRFQGCEIYEKDMADISENGWLTDSVLSFACYYLQKQLKESNRQRYDRVEILPPPVTELVKLSGDENICHDMIRKLKLSEKDRAIFIMSDSSRPDLPYSGSHWRLVVYDRPLKQFKVYDSLTCPMHAPEDLTNNIQLTNMTRYLARTLNSAREPHFSAELCPKQSNNFDCGIYVSEFLECIYLNDTLDLSSMTVDPQAARQKWLQRIRDTIAWREAQGYDYKSSDDEEDESSTSGGTSSRSGGDAVSSGRSATSGQSKMDTEE